MKAVLIITERFHPEEFVINDLAADWARAGPVARSDPASTPASSRQVNERARRAMAGSPVLEKDVVIDREKERNGSKSWPIILGPRGLSM